ncbi:MAG TPA: PIG-L family deacetylase [Bryobacteraceae bacterium]|nr:PIG-L family deacetylase [Bryobacteraceae bacterium]HPT29207.1 PIG-L family deacetylase [Bryobacteraceae bacterium]
MIELKAKTSEIWAPDGASVETALSRTTHLSIAAHQDDIEIMALDGIMKGFGLDDKWFGAVIVTNGAGSPRDGLYGRYSDAEMMTVRRLEQKKAAFVGEYSFVAFLDHPSSVVKNGSNPDPVADIKAILEASKPEAVYTHNLADKHDTHVGVTLHTLRAIRSMAAADRPKKVFGCEVWRDLDWMTDSDKIAFEFNEHENIAASLVGVFDSQIAGGKRYDLATLARRRAHATYHQSHSVDAAQMLNFAMDLTPLIENDDLDPTVYVEGYVNRFLDEVRSRISKLS